MPDEPQEEDARLTVEQALAMLPDGDEVHTYFNPSPNFLLGADWSREDLIDTITRARWRKLTGPEAQKVGHGLACECHGDALFIQTRKPS